jgi:hypothetical protein
MKKSLLFSACACLLLPLATQANPNIRPGEWQTTITMNMPGMPFAPPPRTISTCVTPQQASGSMEDRVKAMQKSDCKLTDFSYKNGRGHWKMICQGRHPATGEGWMTRQDDSHYETKAQMNMQDTGNGVMTITSRAVRVGDCGK